MSRILLLALLVLAPDALLAESVTPSIGFTGAPADHNGQNCSLCHTGSFNDPAGSLTVEVGDYNPGVQQMIHIVVQHPKASRWGFQVTVREISDETQEAGTFSVGETQMSVQVRCDDGSQFGSAPPCNGIGTHQFAEHLDAQRTTIAAGLDVAVLWLPPASEIGKLHVYVSAVAADGDGTAAGDHVYTAMKTIANAGGCSIAKKPVLQTALNGASFQPPFSSNAMISIFGQGFQTSGLKRTAGLGDFENNYTTFPTALACVAVEVTGPGLAQPVRLPIAYVQADQINAQAPTFTGTGPVGLKVIVNAGKSNEQPSDVATLNAQQAFAPAFFVFGTSTSIAAQIGGTSIPCARPEVVAGGRPAKPGEVVTLYGTGFGDTNPSVPAGQLAAAAAKLTNPITVTIGGTTLSAPDVQYAGLSPGAISGLYQFNVKVPSSAADGDLLVTIAIGGFQTQPGVTIPVQH